MDARMVATLLSVILISAFANILLWWLTKYFALWNISSGTYVTLQFGIIWTLVMVIFATVFVSTSKEKFLTDIRKLKPKHYVFMCLAAFVAILSFFLVFKYFKEGNSKLSVFIPLRTTLAVIVLILIGTFYFKEKLNKTIVTGMGLLIIGFGVLMVGRLRIKT